MASITVVGGTGYAGGHLVAEAASRGHAVTAVSRHAPAEPVPGVTYVSADLTDGDGLAAAVKGADAVVLALSPRGDTAGKVLAAYQGVVAHATGPDDRLIVVGGFSALRPAEGAPRFSEGEVPEQFRAEALEMVGVLDWLQSGAADVDWLFVSPAGAFGSFAPGEATGRYRVGGEVALFDEAGRSALSGADFATAIVDEIESPSHHRAHIGVAY